MPSRIRKLISRSAFPFTGFVFTFFAFLLVEPSLSPSVAAPPPSKAQKYGPNTAGAPYRKWQSVRIDGGGFITGLIPSQAPGGTLYARTDVGGAYRWQDETQTWGAITDPLGPAQVESLAADPIEPNLVYVATGGKICRSDDGGKRWTKVEIAARMAGNGPGRSVGERLAIDPNSNNILFFGSRYDGLFRSDDSGATWKSVDGFQCRREEKDPIGITFVLFDKQSGSPGRATPAIYLGVKGLDATFYRSDDAGETWNPVADQPKEFFPNHAALSSTGFLYLAYANGGGPGDMSDGAVWQFNTAKTGPDAWRNLSPVIPRKGSGDHFGYGCVAVDPLRPKSVVVGSMDRWNWGDAMWRTTDAEAPSVEWKELFSSKVKPVWKSPVTYKVRDTHWIGDVEFHPTRSGQLFFAFGLGIQRTDNVTRGAKAEWTFSATGIEETVVLALASPTDGPPLVSGLGDIGGFVHEDLGESPKVKHPNGNTVSVAYAELAPAIMARTGSGGATFSDDGGKTWQPFPTQPAGKGGRVVISADGGTFVMSSSEGVFYSSDKGASWTAIESLPKGVKLASDRVNSQKFYGFDAVQGKIYVSNDGGRLFETSPVKLPTTHSYLSSQIQTVPGFEGHVYVTTANYRIVSCLHQSRDSGQTFDAISGLDVNGKPVTENTAIHHVRHFGFGKTVPGRKYPSIYLTGKLSRKSGDLVDGVFRSDDGGHTWVSIGDPGKDFNAYVIVGDSRIPGRVYVGTPGRGIFYGDP
jgi:photosystem II stability/assembly factor-like uncharacterized protein